MLEIIESPKEDKDVIEMSEMKPLQVGVILEDEAYEGRYVMRTARSGTFEVLDLLRPEPDQCWTCKDCSLKVRLLKEGESITIKLFN